MTANLAALFALIREHDNAMDRRVKTPRGPGALLQVFMSRVAVLLDAEPGKIAFFPPSDVRPE